MANDSAATTLVTPYVLSNDVVGQGGFLTIRRVRLHNELPDGSRSKPDVCDFVERPMGLDAVVVVAWCRRGGEVQVLLRTGLRPALWFGRNEQDGARQLWLTEVVAGVIERGDHGEAGRRARALAELTEEAGFDVGADQLQALGPASFPSPGAHPEMLWFYSCEVDPDAQQPLLGDGSPMEQGATTKWWALRDVMAALRSGELCDGKSEIAVRRLVDTLAAG